MMFCKNCGNQLKSSASFCPSCGGQVDAPAPAQFPQQDFNQQPAYTPEPAYSPDPAYTPETYTVPSQNPYPVYGAGPELPPKKRFYQRWWFWVITVVLLLVIGFLALAGVGLRHAPVSDPVPGDHALVGTWEWDESATYRLIFNSEGQGSRGFFPLIQRFDWQVTDGEYIRKTFRGGVVEQWDFIIRGNVLSIDQQGTDRAYSYIRRGEAPPPGDGEATTQPQETEPLGPVDPDELVGQWLWDRTESLYYTFRADGTGLRGFGQDREFTWRVDEDGGLIMNFGTRDEDWTFNIINDVLTIGSGGRFHSYFRDGAAPTAAEPPAANDPAPGEASALIGTWAYSGDARWRYYFFPDGTGARAAGEEFEWSVEDGNRLYITFESAAANRSFRLREERWTYTIADGVLTLNSRQNPALSYSYTWVE